ncbi:MULTISPECIES: hypothetical protein [unclassified Acinetobacter]|uniref:hypothetical protein n=1 Tax=unclassified Acinetobacter TaxID=196816 RepID=UPI002449BC55|nr:MULTISPECIES: hypothetical protein [unclassified Acinetobacter]MDH0032809.1 hypothetical protein [Acinetobacter sp. GD04021]MDH0888213.1 hypothetical protein [Acinetobacter sp. GD03873]MDH1084598.1 hypothetical protein [Acinetobacter sp. GD03983]MDH2191558.1 hypothetical protein [Acinetobacter sp. GD03645]MDH2205123.1 hypothetical protein [Acinetobacter sp. GD03647]
MNFLKRSVFLSLFAFMALPTVQAEEVTTLPTIRVMAESELREEVGPVPFQEDIKVRQALQHRIYKTHSDMQNEPIKESTVTVDYQPKIAEPDTSQLSPALQQYILAVAMGLQSPDPTDGVFKMLEPMNINRNNVDGIRDGTIKVNVEDILRLQQQIRDGLKSQNQFLMR